MVYIRQHQSSNLSASDIQNYIEDIGNDRFGVKSQSSPGPLRYKEKVSVKKCPFQLILIQLPLDYKIYLPYVLVAYDDSCYCILFSTHLMHKLWKI